jgi:hypothetical protein
MNGGTSVPLLHLFFLYNGIKARLRAGLLLDREVSDYTLTAALLNAAANVAKASSM